MHELFPLMAGGLVGLFSLRIASHGLRALTIVVLSVLLGTAASAVSGELALHWNFLLMDIPLVMAPALVVAFTARRLLAVVAPPR